MQSMKKSSDPSEELRKKLFDIEVSLHLTQEDMEEITIKLIVLNRLHKDLIYNIDLHRSGAVATSMNEYKKTLLDLTKTREEIHKILNLQKKLEDKLSKLVVNHDYYNGQYETVSALEDNNKVLKMEDYEQRKKNPKRKG